MSPCLHGLNRFFEKRGAQKVMSVKTMRLILLIIAVLLIAVGAANGGARDVLVKAINICTECIGLG